MQSRKGWLAQLGKAKKWKQVTYVEQEVQGPILFSFSNEASVWDVLSLKIFRSSQSNFFFVRAKRNSPKSKENKRCLMDTIFDLNVSNTTNSEKNGKNSSIKFTAEHKTENLLICYGYFD